MIDIDPQIQPEPEPEGYEFGYYTFDTLPTLEVTNVEATQKELPETKDKDASDGKLWKLPISNYTLSRLQQEELEWDVLVPLACAAYNFIPNKHSKESPFFLMFGRDPVLPLNTLLGPRMRYLGKDINILSLEAMKNMFEIAATNLKMARE